MEIELTPLGSRAVLGMPAGELWDASVEVDDVRGGLGAELWERLQHAPTWPERFAACDEVLLRRLADAEVAVELQHCWRQIVASRGTVRVGELADGTGYSRQHLAQRFRAEFGLGPKLATRLVRFSRAQSMLRSDPAVRVDRVGRRRLRLLRPVPPRPRRARPGRMHAERARRRRPSDCPRRRRRSGSMIGP